MDPNFTFPRPQPPRIRPVIETPPTSRESNALRASVLDAALLLGVGGDNMVTDWMFNNPLEEEDEEENTMSPALTYASTATSEESFNNAPSAYLDAGAYRYNSKHSGGYPPQQSDSHTTFEEAINSNSTLMLSSAKETNTNLSRPTTPIEKSSRNKLKKRRADAYGTGYESEGGYASEGAVGRKNTEKKKKETSEKVKEGKLADAEKKVKAKEEKERAKERKKAAKQSGIRTGDGYETDGGYISESPELSKFKISRSKSKFLKSTSKSSEHSYETDSGYVSSTSKQKRSFFRLSTKISKTDLTTSPSKKSERNVEVPPVPSVPLPIAEMFSTTSGGSAMGSRVGTPAPSLAVGSVTLRPSPSSGLSLATSTLSPGSEMSFSLGFGLSPATSIYSPSTSGTSVHSAQRSAGSDEGKDKKEAIKRKGSKLNESESESGSSNGHGNIPATLKTNGAHPTISLPLTRPLSPVHPVANNKPTLSSLSLDPSSHTGQAKSTSNSPIRPSPSSPLPGSPFILVTPVGTSSPKPFDQSLTASNNTYPKRAASQLSIIPSTEYIVPSPNSSPTLPSVLAYYDLPPPSPPPSGPLPPPPPTPSVNRSRSSNSPARIANISTNINTNVPPVLRASTLFNQPIPTIQRGREAPFPTRPLLPQVATKNMVGPGLEGRMRVRRYRDLYAIPNPTELSSVAPGIQVEIPSDGESDDDEEDMRDLLDRFMEEIGDHGGVAIPTRRSFEDLRDFNEVEVEEDDNSIYPLHLGRTKGEARSSSPSIYSRGSILMEGDRRSRGSFLDGGRSEEARERFLQRVEAMYDETGREKMKAEVPPMPRLPVVNQRWGRF